MQDASDTQIAHLGGSVTWRDYLIVNSRIALDADNERFIGMATEDNL